MYSYKASHTLYLFFCTLIDHVWFSTTHFIVMFITMCNIINVNCSIELIY